MKRQRFLIWTIFSFLLGFTSSSHAADTRRPNILFLITDDQRFDQMGNMNRLIHTPEMDRLAREGVQFKNAFVTTPICAASRASLLCGLVERTHRYTFKTPPLSEKFVEMSFPTLLRKNGYKTGYVGKFGVRLHPGGMIKLYNYYRELGHPYWKRQPDGSMKHLTDIEGDLAMDFLSTHVRSNKEQPFCLTVGFNAPHAEDPEPLQYFWQKEVDHLYENVQVPRPPLSDPAFYKALPPYLQDTMNRHRWHWRFDFESKRQSMTKGYWRMISGVDLVIGRLRQHLKELNLETNTIIILTSDNGYFLGERGYADKWLPYEQSIRVPMIAFDPSGQFTKMGHQATNFVLNIDLPPTILALTGMKVPPQMRGRSLITLLTGHSPQDWRKDMWFEHLMMEPSIRKHETVRGERYKYSRYFEANPILEELYDLQEDPLETVNLVNNSKHIEILQQLRARTDELRDHYGGKFNEAKWKETTP